MRSNDFGVRTIQIHAHKIAGRAAPWRMRTQMIFWGRMYLNWVTGPAWNHISPEGHGVLLASAKPAGRRRVSASCLPRRSPQGVDGSRRSSTGAKTEALAETEVSAKTGAPPSRPHHSNSYVSNIFGAHALRALLHQTCNESLTWLGRHGTLPRRRKACINQHIEPSCFKDTARTPWPQGWE